MCGITGLHGGPNSRNLQKVPLTDPHQRITISQKLSKKETDIVGAPSSLLENWRTLTSFPPLTSSENLPHEPDA
jgi:hypothetical protein